jgi:hypothetical protein
MGESALLLTTIFDGKEGHCRTTARRIRRFQSMQHKYKRPLSLPVLDPGPAEALQASIR